MAKSLEIRLLGPFEALAGARPSSVSGSKREALLALLALRHGRVVAVDTLVEALWGEDLPAAPRNAVQHHVARLRAALGQDAITGSPDGYMLQDAHVDCERFEELLAETRAALREGDAHAASEAVAVALGLWRGPALHGLTEMEWFAAEARRLEGLRVDALEEQFEAELALGRHREIVAALRTTLAEAPYRERLWGQLMLALYRSGRQADALDAYQEARTALSEELGLEPGPELRRLQEAVLGQDPAIAAVPVAPARTGNLPAPVTSFVGRAPELEQVRAALRANRLVTLTGPPGVGKSRLAVEAARAHADDTGDGAWFVDLARAGRDTDVVRVLAQALDARGPDPLARAVARLRGVDAVVVLDACEHAATEAARVAAALLTECPGVRMLATSREALHLPAEVRIHVGPLALANGDGDGSPAVALFVERARAARPGFELSPESERVAGEIVRRVDGLPLAIELAAARVSVLGLPELLEAVDHRSLLGDGASADPAHAALRALVEWSYDLLHEDEQALLQQLAVHRGGASLASLVSVAATRGLDEPTVTYLVGALVDKSIVSVSFPDDRARYDLLDSVRDYVLERLAETGELDATRRAHAERFAGLAESAWAELRGPEWQFWVRRLDLDDDNLWAALTYAVEAADADIASPLGTLGWHFVLAERISEGRRFLELALRASSEETPVEARVELLALLCYLRGEERDFAAALETGEQALALAEDAPPRAAALAATAFALALSAAGEHERAAALADDARAGYAEVGDDWGLAASGLARAVDAAFAGDLATVAGAATEIRSHAQAIGFEAFEVPAWLLEAWVAERREEGEAADEAYARALDAASRADMGDHASFALAGLGANAAAGGDLLRAEELHRRALAAAEETRSSWAAAHARLQLARVLRASGDEATAERLYANVLEWGEAPRPRLARESLFHALAGDPAEAARAEAGTPSPA